MLKKFLIMISLMTAFNLMGQEEQETSSEMIITDEITEEDNAYIINNELKEEETILTSEETENSSMNQETSENTLLTSESIESTSVKSQADFPYIYGTNFSDLITNEEEFDVFSGDFEATLMFYYGCTVKSYFFKNGNLMYNVVCIPTAMPENELFEREYDYQYFALGFNENYYVPQGITKDIFNNILISQYFGTNNEDEGLNDYEKASIITKFDVVTKKVKKIYRLYSSANQWNLTFKNKPHVGGIAYVSKLLCVPNNSCKIYEILLVTDGYYKDEEFYINAYLMEDGSLTLLSKKKINIAPDAMGFSNGYVWVARFGTDNATTEPSPINGYKIQITYDLTTGINVALGTETQNGYWTASDPDVPVAISTANISVVIPKNKLQGVYSLANITNEEGRYKFYLTSSYSEDDSYLYIATLDTDKTQTVIDGPEGTKWQWESIYSPYGGDYSLPSGIEGVVLKGSELWVPNEGATMKYDHWDSSSDKARELLRINPLNGYYDMLQTGSITVYGNGIDSANYGEKAVLVMAQNKKGEFYYSLGRLTYSGTVTVNMVNYSIIYDTMKMFLEKPSETKVKDGVTINQGLNPVGLQLPTADNKAKVYVEDIKAVFVMNLRGATSTSTNLYDDFTFSYLELAFDETKYNINNGDTYKFVLNPSDFEMGDDSSDYLGYFSIFNHRYSLSNLTYSEKVKSSSTTTYTQEFYDLQVEFNSCLTNNSINTCLQTTIPQYIETNEALIFCPIKNKLNTGMNRLTLITMPVNLCP